MFQFPLTAGQSTTDLAQSMRPPQRAEQHRNELAPTAEATGRIFGFVLAHSLLEFRSWKEL
jgi:hypothetical protein